ncbi:hypothetical protein AB0M02_35915 [Actinoplanes sp. NPDC051861]|uniref:helix-turn-helix transcriptional regulator n=1 Tax=Actinoplanes sp. NPDC051861 TaxID=3155170 RepID=UPI00341ACC35
MNLTLEEKAALCLGSTFWHTAPIERAGIPAIGAEARALGVAVVLGPGVNQATDRLRVSADVDERTLREIYLPHFERIRHDGPSMVSNDCFPLKREGVSYVHLTHAYSWRMDSVPVRLVGAHEIRLRIGAVSRQRAYELARRPDFPAPVAKLAQGSVWLADEVDAWIEARRRRLSGGDQ